MDIESLFHRALDVDPAEREDWLERECADDQQMLARARGLLKNHEHAASFLEHAPDGLARTMLQDESASALTHPVLLRDNEGNEPAVKAGSTEMPKSTAGSRYQIQGEIARGGMGAILKGRDTKLGRDLAVKVLLDSHRDKPDVIHRFIEEAQIGGQLQHPGIAPVYDISQFSDQRPFFTMKLVKGKTLAALLEDRESPADDRTRFLGILEQVCQTIAYAHSRGVIHRDLKPANIMVGSFGEVQVMDWGLAKVLAAGGIADERKARDSQFVQSIVETIRSSGGDTPAIEGAQTQMGSVMGTPAYMPPEQALGEVDQLSERSDVFALGAIGCEILTGKPPYVAEDPIQVFRLASRCKLDDCETRLEACEADHELKTLLRDCLAAEPRERPRDASVVAARMARYQENVNTRLQESELDRAAQSVRLVEERKRRRVSLAFAGALIAFITLAAGGGFWMQSARSQAAEKLATANKTLAAKETQRADQEQEAKEAVQQLLYAASINLAQAELKNSNPTRAQELLDEQTPKAGERDLRGFEWNYLKRLTMNEEETNTIDWADSLTEAWAASDRTFPEFIDGISHDRKTIAAVVASDDEDGARLYVWDTETGSEIYSRAVKKLDPGLDVGDRQQDIRIALDDNGTLVALAKKNPDRQASSPHIVVIDVKSGDVVRKLDAFPGERYSIEIAFRPRSRDLVVVTSDQSRIVTRKVKFQLDSWNVGSGEKQYSVDLGLAYFMNPPVFCGDGSRFAIHYRSSLAAFEADPGTLGQLAEPPGIHVYDASTGMLKQVLETMPWRSNHGFALNQDGTRLACCTNDWSLAWSDLDLDAETALVIWDVASGLRVCQKQTGIVEGQPSFNSEGTLVSVSQAVEGTRIEVYESEFGTLLMNADHTENGVVRFLQKGQRLQVLDRHGVHKTWTIPIRGLTAGKRVAGGGMTVPSRDGQFYARLDESQNFGTIRTQQIVKQQIRVYDRSHRRVCTAEVSTPRRLRRLLEFNSDNTRLYTLDYPEGEESCQLIAIEISNPQNKSIVAKFDAKETISGLLAGPHPSQLIAATKVNAPAYEDLQGTLRIWDLNDGTNHRIQLKAGPEDLQLSHDGRLVAVSHGSMRDNWCSFFDVQSGELAHEFQTEDLLSGLFFSHDGKRLAGMSDRSGFKVLDSKTGNSTLTIPATGADYVAFSAADDRLIMLSSNASGRSFQVCDASSGLQLLSAYHKGHAAWSRTRFISATHELISCSPAGVPIIRDGSPIKDKE